MPPKRRSTPSTASASPVSGAPWVEAVAAGATLFNCDRSGGRRVGGELAQLELLDLAARRARQVVDDDETLRPVLLGHLRFGHPGLHAGEVEGLVRTQH